MDLKTHSVMQHLSPEQRLFVTIVLQAYEDTYLRPKRQAHRFNDVFAYQWLLSEADKKHRAEVFDLAGICQESMDREMSMTYAALSGMITEERDAQMLRLIPYLIIGRNME